MKKKTVVICVAFVVVGFLLAFIGWKLGFLFVRLSNAVVNLNSAQLNDSEVYYSGNGDYLLFMNSPDSVFSSYSITDAGKKVGIPARPIPSSFSKSVKNDWFVICLHCEVVSAGTSKLDSNSTISTTSDGIMFHIENDRVQVRF